MILRNYPQEKDYDGAILSRYLLFKPFRKRNVRHECHVQPLH